MPLNRKTISMINNATELLCKHKKKKKYFIKMTRWKNVGVEVTAAAILGSKEGTFVNCNEGC